MGLLWGGGYIPWLLLPIDGGLLFSMALGLFVGSWFLFKYAENVSLMNL